MHTLARPPLRRGGHFPQPAPIPNPPLLRRRAPGSRPQARRLRRRGVSRPTARRGTHFTCPQSARASATGTASAAHHRSSYSRWSPSTAASRRIAPHSNSRRTTRGLMTAGPTSSCPSSTAAFPSADLYASLFFYTSHKTTRPNIPHHNQHHAHTTTHTHGSHSCGALDPCRRDVVQMATRPAAALPERRVHEIHDGCPSTK